jgi:hypothetical protein
LVSSTPQLSTIPRRTVHLSFARSGSGRLDLIGNSVLALADDASRDGPTPRHSRADCPTKRSVVTKLKGQSVLISIFAEQVDTSGYSLSERVRLRLRL